MKLILSLFACTLSFTAIFSQTEGWTNTCVTQTHKVMEIMVDACGDAEEFNREYVLLRAGEIPLSITDFSMRVTNPFNNSFIGSVIVERGYANPRAIDQLNRSVNNAICPYGISFRDVMAPPYNGVVPPNTPVLVFNNKDSIDLSFLDATTLSALCGSKVLVAIGTVRPQSPGTPIFRNYPRNRSCGTTGCLRTISFQFEKSAPFCQQITYDILKLPHPAVIRPNEEFGDGSFIRFGRNNTVEYLGGGPNGASTVCLPDENMRCIIPAQPSFGSGFWNVLAFDGFKNFSNFKGFYQAKGDHPTTETNSDGSFEYNTARDGWRENDAPSEAHPTYGARAPYDGCNVRADSFTIVARKQGFSCGDYTLRLINYDDFLRVRVDTEGDGTWDFDQTFESENCAECNTELWQGRLATNSRVEIQSADLSKRHSVHLVFEKKTTGLGSIKIAATTTNTSNCRIADGTLNASITGGVAPYQIRWTGPSPIPNEATSAINLNAGVYVVTVTDGQQCRDSARILVAKTSDLIVNAGRDTAFCAGGIAILRGSASGGTGTLTYSWDNLEGRFLTNQPQLSVSPAQTTAYVFTAFDTKGCSKTDTIFVKVNSPPLLKVTISTSDTICNDANPRLTVTGAQTYQWSSNPPIGKSAVRGGDLTASSILVDAIFLPAPVYTFSVEGTDANGCKNTASASPIVINPLPVVVFTPVRDTLCSNGAPQPLRVSIPDGVFNATVYGSGQPCVGCISENRFLPNVSGIGKFSISYFLKDKNGCTNMPFIEINVKECKITCPKSDTSIRNFYVCDPQLIGKTDTQRFKSQVNNCDSFVLIRIYNARQTPAPVPFETFVCEGDSLRIGNQWFKETGQYLITLKNTEGCDSLVALNLTVRKSTLINIEKTTCDSTKLGVEVFRTGGSGGCDSITTVRTVFQRKNIPFAITLESPVSCDGKADGALNVFMPDAPIEEFKLKWNNGDSVDRIANLRPGLYFLTVTDNEGCKATESFDLKNPPPLSIEATGIAPKCANEPQGSLRLTAISGGTEPYRYRVSRFTDTIRALPFTVGNIDIGRYRLRIFDDNGCSSDTMVDVNAGRELALSVGSDVTISLGDTVDLTPLSSIPIERARWTPFNGGILCDTCFSTRVRPVETTTYTLTATDIVGCTDSARITILVENKLRLFVPNTFTPNGDGINDVLNISVSTEVERVRLFQIFNRWGNLLFQTQDFDPSNPTQSWDGSYQGTQLPPDVFVYQMEVVFKDGQIKRFEGDVTLVR